MGFYQLHVEQQLSASLAEVWEFISSPANLKKITPVYMGFDIITKNLPPKIYPGMIISYKVRPVGRIPVRWVTEITHVKDYEYFVDEQRAGPYAMWHHEHHIRPFEGGVLMNDIISYKPPYGLIGSAANALVIRKKLNEIFSYRRKTLEALFNKDKISL